MNRWIILLVLTCTSQAIFAQYVYTIKADSVKITNSCDTAELIIENHTQNVPGFLYNKGRGRTEFRRGAIKLNDSMYLIGADTLRTAVAPVALNGLSISNGKVVLGQSVGQSGSPADLLSNREIPQGAFNLSFTGTGNVGYGTNSPSAKLHIVGTADVPQLLIVNAPVQTAPLVRILSSTLARLFEVRTVGTNSIFLGVDAGLANSASFCIGIGNEALNVNTTGTFNTAIGAQALRVNTTGANNTAIAPQAMYANTTGSHNVAISALQANITGTSNTAIGVDALNGTKTGNNNTALGRDAGRNNTAGSGNVFLGRHAGYTELGSNKLYISNVNTTDPLIYGEFDNGILRFNSRIFVGSTANPAARVHIAGGTATAGSAPLKFTAGTILTTPEDGAIEFDGTELFLTANSIRYKLSKILEGQLTTSFGGPSLSAYNSVTTTLTVSGAQPGDVVNVSANSGAVNPPSIIITAYVTSANTVTLQAYNASNSAVTIASDTYKVRVIK